MVCPCCVVLTQVLAITLCFDFHCWNEFDDLNVIIWNLRVLGGLRDVTQGMQMRHVGG